MVRLPHSVFKLILSYKDPRYERVRNGDPYMATPTRVWYTKGERRQATDPYKDASMYETPSEYHWGTPAIERFGPESQLWWIRGWARALSCTRRICCYVRSGSE